MEDTTDDPLLTALRSAAEVLQEVIDVNDRRLLDMRYALRAAAECVAKTREGEAEH